MTNDAVSSSDNTNSWQQTQILTYASSVHQICLTKHDQDGALVLLKELMESFSQAIVGLGEDAASLQLQEALSVEAKKLFLWVTRLSNLYPQPLLLLVERPFLFQQILRSVIHLGEGLASFVDWTNHLGLLNDVIEEAVSTRARLLDQQDTLLRELIHDQIQTGESRKDLARALQKKKRKLFKESVHQHRDAEAKEAAKQDVRFLDELIGEVSALIEKLQPSSNGGGMDASASVMSPMMDESMASMSGPNLPPWAVCPVSKRILIDPVTVRADCNHTLSKTVFQEWLNADNTTCPVCGCKLKALCAKADKQLKWKLEELEGMGRSIATLAHIPSSTKQEEAQAETRRFSTGAFTSRKMVVPETNKSAADKAPMALKGEGINVRQQQQNQLTASQVLQWTSNNRRESLASIVEHESTFGGSSNAPLTAQERSDMERQTSESTQVISNCANNNNNMTKDTSAGAKVAPTNPEGDASNHAEETTTNHSSTSVSFSPTVVTNFIGSKAREEHNSHTNTTTIQEAGETKVVYNYVMVDRSKLGKKPRKNPVKKLFQKVLGGSHNKPATKPSSRKNAVSSAKIVVKYAASSNSLDNNTDMTADLSNNSNGDQASILKKNMAITA